ncbi:UNVERIFIED_CONTAM: hypothetical protein Sradi_4127500 [Sesamum radiatum]|uniref:Uncharacterized protein n=1 Tax=Sesamum radiatum TaxID=300843 RepID=A0AAW2P2N2_SESRA
MAMEEFNDCIISTGLLHLPVQGARFTWHNCSDGGRSLWKRLDRALVNDEWLNKWPNTTVLSTMPQTSDNSALVLQRSTVQREATMFRFDNYLARSHGFLSKVANVWQNNIYGTVMYLVTRKLKLLKLVFRQMRKENGDLATSVKLASEFLAIVQEHLIQS